MRGYLKSLIWAGIVDGAVAITIEDQTDLFLRTPRNGWICFPFGDENPLALVQYVRDESQKVPDLTVDCICSVGRLLDQGGLSCSQ